MFMPKRHALTELDARQAHFGVFAILMLHKAAIQPFK